MGGRPPEQYRGRPRRANPWGNPRKRAGKTARANSKRHLHLRARRQCGRPRKTRPVQQKPRRTAAQLREFRGILQRGDRSHLPIRTPVYRQPRLRALHKSGGCRIALRPRRVELRVSAVLRMQAQGRARHVHCRGRDGGRLRQPRHRAQRGILRQVRARLGRDGRQDSPESRRARAGVLVALQANGKVGERANSQARVRGGRQGNRRVGGRRPGSENGS